MVVQERAAVQSVDRALEVLEVFAADDRPRGVSELARDTGLPTPIIRRLLDTLSEASGSSQKGPHAVLSGGIGDSARADVESWTRSWRDEQSDARPLRGPLRKRATGPRWSIRSTSSETDNAIVHGIALSVFADAREAPGWVARGSLSMDIPGRAEAA